jgi:alpha-mannosidase
VHVELVNHAEDHRLRLCVASGCRADHVWCEGHFDLVRRPVRPPAGDGWFQSPQPTMPQRRFAAVQNGRRGLAVLNRGLPEVEPRAGEHGVDLAVTLLRCVGWLSRDDLTSRPQGAGPALPVPGAQCPGRHVFELAVMPLPGEDWHAPLLHEADLFAAPPRARGVEGRAVAPTRTLALTAPLVMTACTRATSRPSLLVRIWNPSPRRVEGALTPGVSFAEAHLVRLDETRLEPIVRDGSAVPLVLEPQEVRTVELVPDAKEVVAGSEPA